MGDLSSRIIAFENQLAGLGGSFALRPRLPLPCPLPCGSTECADPERLLLLRVLRCFGVGLVFAAGLWDLEEASLELPSE